MAKSCKDIAESLVECIKKTECYKSCKDLKTCIKDNADGECQDLRTSYFLCKRGGLDMRTRIQGPKYWAKGVFDVA